MPNDIKGVLTRTYEKQISLTEWQTYDSSWDVLLTEDIRQNFVSLFRVLSINQQFSHIISDMVEIYNESHGEDLIDEQPSDSDLLEILRHVFIYEILGFGKQDLEIHQTSKSATLQLQIKLPMLVSDLQVIPENIRQGYGFALHLDL